MGITTLARGFNVKSSRSTTNTGKSPAPGRNAWSHVKADMLWGKQTLKPFYPGGKDLGAPRQSLQSISSAVGSFCIILKQKMANNSLLPGFWSCFPRLHALCPQTSSGILGSLWLWAIAMKNFGISEVKLCCEQLIAANTGVFGWSLLVTEQKSCKKTCLCAEEREQPASRARMLSTLQWQIWEFLNENNSLCWWFHFYCIQENGPWVKFFLLFFEGVSKHDYFKIMPRVQLIEAAYFLC